MQHVTTEQFYQCVCECTTPGWVFTTGKVKKNRNSNPLIWNSRNAHLKMKGDPVFAVITCTYLSLLIIDIITMWKCQIQLNGHYVQVEDSHCFSWSFCTLQNLFFTCICVHFCTYKSEHAEVCRVLWLIIYPHGFKPWFIRLSSVRVESVCFPSLTVFFLLGCSQKTMCLRLRRPWWPSALRSYSRRLAKSSSRTVPSKITAVPSVLVYFDLLLC